MGDIYETIDGYEAACKEAGVVPLAYVMACLNFEREECITAKRKGETHENMSLHLAGNNPKMTEKRLNDDDVKIICNMLEHNSYITGLDLRYNNITDEGAKHISKMLEENASLKNLNLMCNDFQEEGAKQLAKALTKNEALQTLRVNGNKFGNTGGMHFAAALQINTTLEALDLAETDLKTECVIALATVLNYNSTLQALNVSRPLLFSHQEETAVHFGKMLKVNRSLKELHLMKQDLRDFGAERLSENLVHNFTLTYLNLSSNRITMDGAKALASFLKQDTALKVLDLANNRIENDGAIQLANVLGTMNTNLTTLVITMNQIGGKGLCAIADCMKFNSSLTAVYIWGNKLEESACIAFAGLIQSGRLELRNTDVKPYVVDGVTYLSELSHGIRRWYYWGPYPDRDMLHAPSKEEFVSA